MRGGDTDARVLSRTGAESAAPMSRLQLAANSDEGACEVTYGGRTQCYGSFRGLCKVANYLYSISTEFHPGETCSDLGYQ